MVLSRPERGCQRNRRLRRLLERRRGNRLKEMQNIEYGIAGGPAPEFEFDEWVDANGEKTYPIRLADHDGKLKVIYCFQSWCPGCHKFGFPTLKKLVDEFSSSDQVEFFVVQTVFEGFEENPYEKIVETQKRYDLKIPFGHDPGDGDKHERSWVMEHYRTGGTPWFIFVDKTNRVASNGFHIDFEKAAEYLNEETRKKN